MKSLDDFLQDVSLLFLDTAPVIYYVERPAPFFALSRVVFRHINSGLLPAITSPITLAECLLYPHKQGNRKIRRQFLQLIVSGVNVQFVPTNAEIADRSAELRGRYNLGFGDSLQVATAIYAGCDGLLTNDKGLRRVEEVRVLVLEDLVGLDG